MSASLQQLRRTYPLERIAVDGVDIEFLRTRGEGPPLVMLPGALGTAESFVHPLLAFGARRDIVSINYPGRDDIAALADLVVACAGKLGIRRFDVLGTSLGGYLSLWIAARHAACVDRLVIGNSFHDPGPSQTPERRARLENRSAEAVKLEVLERTLAEPPGEFREVMLDLVGIQSPAAMVRARMLAVQRVQPLEEGARAPDRMLVIECADDPLIAPSRRAALRLRYPEAEVVGLACGGHYPYLVTPQAYLAAVGPFLGLR